MQLGELATGVRAAYRGADVAGRIRRFNGWTGRAFARDGGAKVYDHAETVKDYYDLCGEFMLFGWSRSLHFAPLSPGESLEESQVRHQRLMIDKLDLREGMTVVDVGCGVGGPMRRVVREGGVRVVGVNNNDLQLEKARTLNAEAGIDHMVDFVACSFMDMSAIADDTFDRGYAIESTCHAPDKAGAFAEIHRILKPGALLWGQEMCLTDRFDSEDDRHRAMEQDLMRTIALKGIATTGEVDRLLEEAGFEVVEGVDRGAAGNGSVTPWYRPMETRRGKLGGTLYRLPLGRKAMIGGLRLAEAVRVFPTGTTEVVRLMDRAARAYVAGGRAGIFTPLYNFLARKPL